MIERILWGLLALLHAVPALAFFRPAMIADLYGAEAGDPNFPLLHHRAALFLVIALVAAWAIIDPAVRRLGSVAVGVSMLSFLLIYWQSGSPPSLRSIAIADLVGLPVLLAVAWQAWR